MVRPCPGVSIPPAIGLILRAQWFAESDAGNDGVDVPLCQAGSPSVPCQVRAVSPAPHGTQTTNSGTSSWVRSNEKYLLVLLLGKVSWMLMHCWAKQPLQ